MKKLLSFLAVAAIVTSAFAFSTKVAAFCVRNTAGTACQIVANKVIVAGVANYKHFPTCPGQWDGSPASCTNAAITDCSVDIRLQNN
jgi:hypothetical protein